MIDILFADITQACNLRCPFCSNNWSEVPFAPPMTEDCFARFIRVAPDLAHQYSLSCAFEPSLHPDYIRFVSDLPERGFAFLTTNLAYPLRRNDIHTLTHSNLKRIQVSVESLIPDQYESYRRGASFSAFTFNLTELAVAAQGQPVELRAMVLAFQSNRKEIPGLVARLKGDYGFQAIDVRTPFDWSAAHMPQTFREQELIPAEDFSRLQAELNLPEANWTDGDNHPVAAERFAWLRANGTVAFFPSQTWVNLEEQQVKLAALQLALATGKLPS